MSNPNAEDAKDEPLHPEDEPLNLFKPLRIRHPEYWQCIKLIAKSSLPSDMTSRKTMTYQLSYVKDYDISTFRLARLWGHLLVLYPYPLKIRLQLDNLGEIANYFQDETRPPSE